MRRVSPPTTSPSRAEHALACHPAMPCAAVRSLRAAWHWRTQGGTPRLHLRYTLHADVQALRLPDRRPPRFADGLWRHTCFEAFVGAEGACGYHEFNFSPSGDWAAYVFRAERLRDNAAALPAPRIACMGVGDGDALTLDVWLPRAALPAPGNAGLTLGLSAVLETRDGQLSYWALHHPGAQPDFHHRDGWTARLPDNRRP